MNGMEACFRPSGYSAFCETNKRNSFLAGMFHVKAKHVRSATDRGSEEVHAVERWLVE